MNNPQLPLGFLGGAFDPVHIGHLRGAMAVRDALDLERVDLIPAAQSPLKDQATVDAAHRLAMLELAVADLQGICLLYTSPSPRDATLSRMPSSA